GAQRRGNPGAASRDCAAYRGTRARPPPTGPHGPLIAPFAPTPAPLKRPRTSELAMQIPPIDKARILSEALPYMQRYDNETVVVKYGGHAPGPAEPPPPLPPPPPPLAHA